jgi:ribosomal protein S18 acetylase RimI-like enzyme
MEGSERASGEDIFDIIGVMEIQHLNIGDAELIVEAAALFDREPRQVWAEEFLTSDGHHLFVASVDGAPAGFVSGVEILHPDKGREMLLYELVVGETFRGRRIGIALVAALRDLARNTGCRGMWVITEQDNPVAVRTYRAAGAGESESAVMMSWDFAEEAHTR